MDLHYSMMLYKFFMYNHLFVSALMHTILPGLCMDFQIFWYPVLFISMHSLPCMHCCVVYQLVDGFAGLMLALYKNGREDE